MSLKSLITKELFTYNAYNGQDESTGSLTFGSDEFVKGRLGGSTIRFDSPQAIDQIADNSLTCFLYLANNSLITDSNGAKFTIIQSYEIKSGNSSKISHYNYLLKNYVKN